MRRGERVGLERVTTAARWLFAVTSLVAVMVATATTPVAADEASQRVEVVVDPASDAAADVGRIWLRVPKSRGVKRAATRSGQLEIDDDRLRFIGRKRSIEIPFASLHSVSFGRMDGDVDTDWTVLEVVEGQTRSLYGLRDGSKLGFGRRTPAIHERLIDVLRRRGVAQYDVPAGSRTYDAFDWQFTTAVPESWAARIGEMVYVGDRAPWGTVLFVAGEEASSLGERGVDDRLFARVRDGEVAAVTLERRQAPRGARCNGFSERARRVILDHLAAAGLGDPAFSEPLEVGESPLPIDGCSGLRLTAAAASGTTIEMRAAVHADVLYLVGLRHGSGAREAYETLLSTLRFAKAR